MNERQAVMFEKLRQMALALPEVVEGTAYGTPAFYVNKRFLGRLLEDGEFFVIRVDELERDFLLQAEPDIYGITTHYMNYPYMLVRLSQANGDDLERLLAAAWRQVAPKRLVKAHHKY